MGFIKNDKDTENFATIVGGKLRLKVNESTPGAERREYEKSNGEKAEKWELVYSGIKGMIVGIEIKKTDFGENLNVRIKDKGNYYTFSLPVTSNYFSSFAMKLPNINFDKEIEIHPYDFEDKQGKRIRGLSMIQNGLKLQNYYYDSLANKWTSGMPVADGDVKNYDSEDWQAHYIKVRKFLKSEILRVSDMMDAFVHDKDDLDGLIGDNLDTSFGDEEKRADKDDSFFNF